MSADKKCVRKCQAQDNTLITHFYYDANYELTIFDGNWHPNLKNVFENSITDFTHVRELVDCY